MRICSRKDKRSARKGRGKGERENCQWWLEKDSLPWHMAIILAVLKKSVQPLSLYPASPSLSSRLSHSRMQSAISSSRYFCLVSQAYQFTFAPLEGCSSGVEAWGGGSWCTFSWLVCQSVSLPEKMKCKAENRRKGGEEKKNKTQNEL